MPTRIGVLDSRTIRSFLNGRHKDDEGHCMSTGGFTKSAFIDFTENLAWEDDDIPPLKI